jgi:hypothetical protein
MKNKIKKLRLWILPIVMISVILIPSFLLYAADWSGLTARKSLGNPTSYAWNTVGFGTSNALVVSSDATIAPDAPTNVVATVNLTDKVTITWDDSAGATDYHVWRGATDLGSAGDVNTFDDTGGVGPSIGINSSSVSQGTNTSQVVLAVDATGVAGTMYTYYVVASNMAGSSSPSAGAIGYRASGSLSYQWYRSSGTGNSDFSELAGATTANYNDATASAPTITAGATSATDGTYNVVQLSLVGTSANAGANKYYYCSVSASDATTVTSTHYSGWVGVGSLTYQWQRSAADADADYSNIGGATLATYSDGSLASLDKRYFKCVLNATGATEQTSTADEGWLDSSSPSPIGSSTNSQLAWLIPLIMLVFVIGIALKLSQDKGDTLDQLDNNRQLIIIVIIAIIIVIGVAFVISMRGGLTGL